MAQKIIDDQHTNRLDTLLDRFVATERLLIEREGKWLNRFGLRFVQVCLGIHL
jgi:hypothetical protein